MSSSLSPFHVLMLVWLELCTTAGVNGCSVTPSSAAVVAGGNLSLTCTTANRSQFIISWRLESDANSAPLLYQAPSSDSGVSRKVADGYWVNDSNRNIQVILTIVEASTSQANYYYCLCTDSRSAFAYVSVLATKPTFSITSLTDEEPVNIMCSISFNGTAAASVMITNGSGQIVAQKREAGVFPSTSTATDLRVITVEYNASVVQAYSCQVTLTGNSGMIYDEQVTPEQNVSVRNVQINPLDKSRCSNGSKCEIDQTINCTAIGSPYPFRFQWTGFLNETQLNETDESGQYTLGSIGNYTVQCIAFNQIGGITYNRTSEYFKVEVTVDGPPTAQPATIDQGINTVGFAVGIGVGVGVLVIVIVIIVIIVLYKRKKSGTVCCNPEEDKGMQNSQSVELSKSHNGNSNIKTENGVKNNVHITPGVQNKSFGNDEVTLVENDLYSAKSKPQIDPSDGGYASVNEIEAQGK